MKKRIFSLLLCVTLFLTALPTAIFAANGKIDVINIDVTFDLCDGAAMPFDSSLVTVSAPDLYRAYLWGSSWSGADGIYMPDEYSQPHFKGGDFYTLTVLIVAGDGVDGLDDDTAPTLPVFINDERARFNPACSPMIDEAPDKTVYAYEIDLQCPYTNVIDIIDVYGFVPPTPGAVPCELTDLSVPENAPYYISSATWKRYHGDPAVSGASDMAEGETFEKDVIYYILLTLGVREGYTFSMGEGFTWRFNGTSFNGYADEKYSSISSPLNAQFYSADLKAETRHVDRIDIEELGGFYQGATVLSAIENVTAPNAEGYTLVMDADTCVSRDSDNTYIDRTALFAADESYRATFEAYPDTGWTIDKDTVWTINGSTSNVSYAAAGSGYWYVKSEAFPSIERTEIDRIDIYGYGYPELGQTAHDALTMFVVGDLYEIVDTYWYCDTTWCRLNESDVFEADKIYSACVVVKPVDPAFAFSDEVKPFLNGGDLSWSLAGIKPDGSYYVWTQQMEAKTPAVTHTVSWYLDPADDFPATGVEVNDGDVFGLPPEPCIDGYVFGGWFTDRLCTVPYDPTAPIYADIELFPLWIPEVGPDKIAITAIDAQIPAPIAGQIPAGTASVTFTTSPGDAHLSDCTLTWFYWDETLPVENKWMFIPVSDYVFEGGETYAVDIFVHTEDGDDYVFDPAIVGTVNGQPSDNNFDALYQDAGTAYLSYVWAVDIPITEVSIDGFEAPRAGEMPMEADALTVPDGAPYSISSLSWYRAPDPYSAESFTGSFVEGDTYFASICLTPDEGYAFVNSAEDIVLTVNGLTVIDWFPFVDVSGDFCVDTADLIAEGTGAKDPCEGFTDINRSGWYHGAADFVIERSLMGSTNTGTLTFEPNTKVSRAMVASILYRMAGSPAVAYAGTFTDVPSGKWFTDAIEWCAQNGLASGKGAGIFDPNGSVTRQELAVFMMKMAQYLENPTDGRDDLSGFADADQVPAWASDYVRWAVSAGLISGKAMGGKTCLAPTDNATRAEFASIIMRFCNQFGS